MCAGVLTFTINIFISISHLVAFKDLAVTLLNGGAINNSFVLGWTK